jgi:plasmid replication initiation protein
MRTDLSKSIEQYGEALYGEYSNTVLVHKSIVEACFKMSVPAKKIFLLGVWRMARTPEIILNEKRIYRQSLSRQEISKHCKISKTNDLKQIAWEIQDKPKIWINEIDENGNQTGNFSFFHMITDGKYKDGVFTIGFHEWIFPYVKDLKRLFARLRLYDIRELQSTYAIRFYMICRQWELVGSVTYTVETLKKILCIENKYKLVADFKRHVLNTAYRELKEYSNLYFEYETQKMGKKIKYIKIKILKNLSLSVSQNKYIKQKLSSYLATYKKEDFYNNHLLLYQDWKDQNKLISQEELEYFIEQIKFKTPMNRLSKNLLTDFFVWFENKLPNIDENDDFLEKK